MKIDVRGLNVGWGEPIYVKLKMLVRSTVRHFRLPLGKVNIRLSSEHKLDEQTQTNYKQLFVRVHSRARATSLYTRIGAD